MGNIYAIRLKKIVKSILPSSGVLWLRERQTSALAFIGYVNHYGAFHKKEEKNVIFGGRLGRYRYFDMHQVVSAALDCVHEYL